MRTFARNFYYSFPIQLLLLHFRKSQVLLIFWVILFLTITGHFLKLFGADALFLSPEYLGNVNAAGAAIIGVATGVFMMSWNITTFIIHSSRCRFLATTSNPFLKYCLNNALIPAIFLIVYFFNALNFGLHKELITLPQFLINVAGFLGGFILLLLISFAYFFTADKRILRFYQPGFLNISNVRKRRRAKKEESTDDHGLKVGFYFNSYFSVKKARPVAHYNQTLLDEIFKRHHFSALITILLAFVFMVFIAFFLDNVLFQVPAAASVLILFAILIAVLGALSYFLRSWSLLFLITLFLVVNFLYQKDIIDPHNKAYGLDYTKEVRPLYTLDHLRKLNSAPNIEADKKNMLTILAKWKEKQPEEKPLLVVFNFSGGGLRGAGFSLNVLQQLDSITQGKIMDRTMLMTGASGGMLAGAYFRELARQRDEGEIINIASESYYNNISNDLLNPVFSAMIARDLITPRQKFTYNGQRYIKDRGYAFEQKLDLNTKGILDKRIGFYKEAESNADIPLMILNSVITRDLKKLMVCTQPLSFMMQEEYIDSSSYMSGPDAVDFAALFKNENPMDLRLLSALRMNATYPYVLPAVWLPSEPVIEVMDAGLRDNNGQETTLRFLNVFRNWINENTSGVLIIQIRSRQKGSWDTDYKKGGIADIITKPFTMLQNNWFVLQDYFQDDEISYAQNFLSVPLNRVAFMYIPEKADNAASLNFHLTTREKLEVKSSLSRLNNVKAFEEVQSIMGRNSK
ncbi:MAG: hypothetical protein ABIN48_14340 [Ginsengibacter sp.]